MTDDAATEPDPAGCPAVVILSDGARLILADGTVARIEIRDRDGAKLPCVSPSNGVYRWADDGTRVEVALPTDSDARNHPRVAEALTQLDVDSPREAEDE